MESALLFFALLSHIQPLSSQALAWEARLNNDSFMVREAAFERLVKEADFSLCRQLRRSKYAEVRRRARSLYEHKRGQLLASLEPFPMLDALWYDTTTRCYRPEGPFYLKYHPYIELYRNPNHSDYGSWRCYRLATRHWVIELLDRGTPLWLIKAILAEMRRRDAVFLGVQGLP